MPPAWWACSHGGGAVLGWTRPVRPTRAAEHGEPVVRGGRTPRAPRDRADGEARKPRAATQTAKALPACETVIDHHRREPRFCYMPVPVRSTPPIASWPVPHRPAAGVIASHAHVPPGPPSRSWAAKAGGQRLLAAMRRAQLWWLWCDLQLRGADEGQDEVRQADERAQEAGRLAHVRDLGYGR